MKKLITITIVILSCTLSVFSQKRFNAVVGMNVSRFRGDDLDDVKPFVGYVFGGMWDIKSHEYGKIQVGLIAKIVGTKNEYDDTETWYDEYAQQTNEVEIEVKEKIKLTYLSIPVRARLLCSKKFSVISELQFDFLTKAEIDVNVSKSLDPEYWEKDNHIAIEKICLGLSLGVQYDFTQKLGMYLHYYTGLTDISQDPTTEIYNENISFGLLFHI